MMRDLAANLQRVLYHAITRFRTTCTQLYSIGKIEMSSCSGLQHRYDPTVQRKAVLTLFLLISSLFMLTGAFRIDSGDGEAMYQVTRSMVEGRGFSIPPSDPDALMWGLNDELVTVEEAGHGLHGIWGSDGQLYTGAGLGWSLVATPFYVVGTKIADLTAGAAVGLVTRAAVTLVDTLALTVAAVLLFLLASRLYPLTTATFISLAYAFASIAWSYARGTFSEPLVALGLLWAVLCACRAQEEDRCLWWALAGVGLGGGLLARQAEAVMVLPVAAWALASGWRAGRLRGAFLNLCSLALPVALAQGTVLAYNALRFGNPLNTGYLPGGLPGSRSPFPGLYGLLLSPGKGLLVFVPLTLLGFAGWPAFLRKRPALGAVLLAMIGLQLLVYASTGRAWAGGLSWGPRHLVPVLAFCLLPIGEVWPMLRRKRWLELAAAFLLAASVVIQMLGISVYPSRHQQAVYAETQDLGEFFHRVHFTWADSPIPGQVRSLLETTAMLRDPERLEQLHQLVEDALAADPQEGQAEAVGLLSYNVPDFWFVYWGFLGVPLGWRIGVAAALAGLAVGAGLWLRRLLAVHEHIGKTAVTSPAGTDE